LLPAPGPHYSPAPWPEQHDTPWRPLGW
jgi:hypothetical protein